MSRLVAAFVLCVLLCPMLAIGGPVESNQPVQSLKPSVERPTEVLVLATEHLSGMDGLTSEHLDSLHAALERFSPTAVVVEAMSERSIDNVLARPDDYDEVAQQFVGAQFLEVARSSQRELGVTPAQAREQLAACQPLPLTDAVALARCLKLAAASYDKAWFGYIGRRYHERHATSPLGAALGEQVAKIGASTNENHVIAGRLAARLDLSRLYGMDYQPGKDLYGPVFEALTPSIEKSTAVAAFGKEARMIVEASRLREQGLKDGDLLPLLRWLNSPEYAGLVVNEEWRLFVDRDLERAPSLGRLALWDVRNLEMVANILRVAAQHPGERILVTVGASHKVFFDDYLERSISIRVRQLDEFVVHEGG